jgi:hypothetical protein
VDVTDKFGIPELIILCVHAGALRNEDVTLQVLLDRLQLELPLWLKVAAYITRSNTSFTHEITYTVYQMCEYGILDAMQNQSTKAVKFVISDSWCSYADRLYTDRDCFNKLKSP